MIKLDWDKVWKEVHKKTIFLHHPPISDQLKQEIRAIICKELKKE